MSEEVRLAQKGEIARLKEIWKLCFGDSDEFIDFYYANRFKEEETVLRLHNGEISAMLTMIPVWMVSSDNQRFKTAMLYAIATHPKNQNRGLATRLMDFTNQYLIKNNIQFSVLVPAEKKLFDFYRKQGYQDCFYIRELRFSKDMISSWPKPTSSRCTISSIFPKEYNFRRNMQLNGRPHIAYADEEIAYQKKLSLKSGADIYGIDIKDKIGGCLAIERVDADRVLIKEILLPDEFIDLAIQQVLKLLHAKEYIYRTPVFLGNHLGGSIRPFGMIRLNSECNLEISPQELEYLGFAFD